MVDIIPNTHTDIYIYNIYTYITSYCIYLYLCCLHIYIYICVYMCVYHVYNCACPNWYLLWPKLPAFSWFSATDIQSATQPWGEQWLSSMDWSWKNHGKPWTSPWSYGENRWFPARMFPSANPLISIFSTLWLCQNSYWKWPFIVSFPIKNGDFP